MFLSILLGSALLAGCIGTQSTQTYPIEEDNPYATYWEVGGMLDEFTIDVNFEPAKPEANKPVNLVATCGIDDMDRPFKGTVSYRLAKTEESSDPWIPMQGSGERWQALVTLPSGTTFVQFRVKRDVDEEAIDLTDWSITLK
jgi:hypothetical protein